MSVNATNPPVDRTTVLQSKLYQAAQRDPKRRFHALYDKLASSYLLQSAWELVRQNQGAAGIDQQTLADIETSGVPEFLAEIAQRLQDKTYRPQPMHVAPGCPGPTPVQAQSTSVATTSLPANSSAASTRCMTSSSVSRFSRSRPRASAARRTAACSGMAAGAPR